MRRRFFQHSYFYWDFALCALAGIAFAACAAQPKLPDSPELLGRLILIQKNPYVEDVHFQARLGMPEVVIEEVSGEKLDFPPRRDRMGYFGSYHNPVSFDSKFSVNAFDNCEIENLLTHEKIKISNTATHTRLDNCEDSWIWSPDSRNLAIINFEGFYVANVSGDATLIIPRRYEMYHPEEEQSLPIGHFGAEYALKSIFEFGGWLSPDTLLIDHYKGIFPAKFESPTVLNQPGMPPTTQYLEKLDTTSLVRLTVDGYQVVDLQKRWKVVAVATDYTRWVLERSGSVFLVNDEFLYDRQGSEPMRFKSCSNPKVCRFFFSPDGSLLAIDIFNIKVEVWDTIQNSLIDSFETAQGPRVRSDLIWSPTGGALMFRGWGPESKLKFPDIYIRLLDEKLTVEVPLRYPAEIKQKVEQDGIEPAAWLP